MALAPGSSVGHYRIVGTLGAGGMGEVYRAHDTKLGREVALKILPDAVSSDPERRARFAREARSLAALNHQNIAQVHGFEDAEPSSALIMELVEGEDLSERIRRGAIPYDEAIAIARQIGEALQAAHDRGIIHRDLKPANIKVREDGTVKVLDFGLAKALDQGSGIGDPESAVLGNSPTITSPATLQGVVLGTAAYMAPEQAKGRVVDKRADIWAFGCVLYEMLTGRKAFAGDDVSDTLASILKSDLDLTGVPRSAQRLLKKCLEKDPRKRLHDIGDAWDLLDDHAARIEPAPSRASWLPWSLAALFAISTIGIASLRLMDSRPSPPSSARFQIAAPPQQDFSIYISLSPDGRRLAFTATNAGGPSTLWVRDLESLVARQLPLTDNATSPFWSPDGRFIAFNDGSTLKRIEVSGGPPQSIATTPTNLGMGAWNRDGVIVVGTRGVGPLYRVPATGGTPMPLTEISEERGERGHSFPVFLPDQKRVLYVKLSGRPEVEGIYLASIDSAPGQQSQSRVAQVTLGPLALIEHGRGHQLLFVRSGTLMLQAFDADRVQLSGEPQPVAERIGSSGSFAFFGAGGDVLAYRTGNSSPSNAEQLSWNDRAGKEIAKLGEPVPVVAGTNSVAIAPDGKRAALLLSQTQAATADIWLVEFERGLVTRLTSSDGAEASPVWSPDNRRLVFRSSRTANFSFDMFWRDVDGTSEAQSVTSNPLLGLPTDWSRDGRFILFSRSSDPTNADLFALSVESKIVQPLLQTPFAEFNARLSADGRWMAYTSNESGQNEVYVRPFAVAPDGKPSIGAKWRVSTAGGVVPRWRADGQEMFYRTNQGDFMAVDVKVTADAFQTTLPHRLFPTIPGVHAWDVTADGKRFLISTPLRTVAAPPADPITVVLNWQMALQQK